jgi:SAM-dependent methyltransferase
MTVETGDPTTRAWLDALRSMRAELPRVAGVRSGDRVLCLCGGTGGEAAAIAAAAGAHGRVVIADRDSESLELANERAALVGLTNVEVRRCDVMELPADLRDFDVLTCVLAIHLLPDPLAALEHWRSRLRPGGAVALVEWGPTGPAAAMDAIAGAVADVAEEPSDAAAIEPWRSNAAAVLDGDPWSRTGTRVLEYRVPHRDADAFWVHLQRAAQWAALRGRIGPSRHAQLDARVRERLAAAALPEPFEQTLRFAITVARRT